MSSTLSQSFKSQFLIAMPSMADPSFTGALTLICEHSEEGALGLVVNRPSTLLLSEIFQQMGITTNETLYTGGHSVYAGGPVSQERGFVLHSGESNWDNCMTICSGIQLTTSNDILSAMAENRGPKQSMVALGYAGWGAGQLEQEIADNTWLTCQADPAIIFETPYHLRLNAAAKTLGVDLSLMSDQVGHA
ncbi:YqgE/AlgH family protein [uncultured Endozoicomonas sp.]|uniref:YqgE/AlgH family protein n=1 Tax=uncultured Endozoicomonas sp. TaxID=432652 RepID=UPI0026101451|nr:YqgE/AlgH family protein [uncultured Endozoicomonas sp.]